MAEHYDEHKSKPWFKDYVSYCCSGPVVAMCWEGKSVIEFTRTMIIGGTNPVGALQGTARGDYCLDASRNILHGSHNREAAEREIKIWFKDEELINYDLKLKEILYDL